MGNNPQINKTKEENTTYITATGTRVELNAIGTGNENGRDVIDPFGRGGGGLTEVGDGGDGARRVGEGGRAALRPRRGARTPRRGGEAGRRRVLRGHPVAVKGKNCQCPRVQCGGMTKTWQIIKVVHFSKGV